jgi:hypothetical protein
MAFSVNKLTYFALVLKPKPRPYSFLPSYKRIPRPKVPPVIKLQDQSDGHGQDERAKQQHPVEYSSD